VGKKVAEVKGTNYDKIFREVILKILYYVSSLKHKGWLK